MKLSRRTLLGASIGLAGSRALAAFYQGSPANLQYVTPQSFGAVPDDPAAAEANVRAFNAMAGHAVASGSEMIIPKGVWYLKADGGKASGWTVRPSAGRPCIIRGEGAASIIRRAPATVATKFASMIQLWVTAGGESFDLQGFAIDGNEASFPYDAAEHYAYQQAHCILLAARQEATVAAASMRIFDLSLSGVVADGIKVGAQCERFEAQRVMASGRTRRTRSDIQFSRLPRLALVSDCQLDAFESEPKRMVEGATMRLRNLVARASFDLAAPDGDYDGRLIVEADNCQGGLQRTTDSAVMPTSLYRLQGTFANCAFATAPARNPAHNNVVRGSRLTFERTRFLVGPSFADASDAAPLFTHFERVGEAVQFNDCLFEAARGVIQGSYVGVRSASPSCDLALRDCVTSSALDFVATMTGPANVTIAGGELKARRAIVAMTPKAARQTRIATSDRGAWKAPLTSVTEQVTLPQRAAKPSGN